MGKGAKKYYEDKGIIAPFSLMSRRPGIGFDYMEKYADEFLKHGNCLVNSSTTGLPRYYKEKLDFKNSDFYREFMDKRQEYLEKVYSEMWMSSSNLQDSIKQHLEGQRQAVENLKFYERIVKNAKI
nr:replication initiation protein [Microvirus sp.]